MGAYHAPPPLVAIFLLLHLYLKVISVMRRPFHTIYVGVWSTPTPSSWPPTPPPPRRHRTCASCSFIWRPTSCAPEEWSSLPKSSTPASCDACASTSETRSWGIVAITLTCLKGAQAPQSLFLCLVGSFQTLEANVSRRCHSIFSKPSGVVDGLQFSVVCSAPFAVLPKGATGAGGS